MSKKDKFNLKFDKSIDKWENAIPLGNGEIGCLIYGKKPIIFALDRGDLWDERTAPETKEKGFNYKNLVRLCKSGNKEDWEERCRLFDRITDYPYPTKLTAGKILIDFENTSDNIKSNLDIFKAVAFVDGGNDNKIYSFISATKGVGVARIYGNYNINLHLPSYFSKNTSSRGLGYPICKITREKEYIYLSQQTLTDFSFAIVVYIKQLSNYKELYFTVATNKIGKNFIEETKERLKSLSKYGYDALYKEHIIWWKKYWNKSSITLSDEIIEKTYYRSYYLFGSCSRKGQYPMPLQGLWTADNDCLPPWKGDYHHDTNTELSYQSYLKANRLSEGSVFIDYIWKLRYKFKEFTKNFYNVNGILIPACSTLNGEPIGGWPQYSLSPTMTIWVAQSFDEYYLYTGDEKFLKSKAYPFFKEVETAIKGLLKKQNGKYYLELSSSPEIFDDTIQSYLEPNSNFDLSLLIYLYKTLINYSLILGYDYTEYTDIYNKLDKISIDDEYGVMLDKKKLLTETHRHFSHVMCLYPLHLINFDNEENKKIYQNTIFSLEKYGTGRWVGFSFAMMSQIYAMAEMGNSAYEKLKIFSSCFVAENGFHLNGDFKNYGYTSFHYNPFTLESLFGYCDALQEMLLQNHRGYIHLFPSIPDEWKSKTIKFNKFRSYKGVLVSSKCVKGKVEEVDFEVKRDTEICLKDCFNCNIKLKSPNANLFIKADEGYFKIKLFKGKTTLLV